MNKANTAQVKDPAAAAMGVELPVAAQKPVEEMHTSDVQVHDSGAPVEDLTEAHLKGKGKDQEFQLRWVAADENRDRVGAAIEKGWVPVKAEEAQTHGIMRGHKGPDGYQRWGGGDMSAVLMKQPKKQYRDRKYVEKRARDAEIKRIKELYSETVRKEGGDKRDVIGDVNVR